MRRIRWLHISDLHLRTDSIWSQDIVLKAILEQVRQATQDNRPFDFVVVTGDVAFSGQTDEYSLAEDFFHALAAAAGLGLGRIFCVPGNHDVDRARQTLAFQGARTVLQSSGHVDELLSGGEDLQALLLRQENYWSFHNALFPKDGRFTTMEGLCYLAHFTVANIAFSVIGLNSAWLSEGGPGDHHELLIGERQAITTTSLVHEQVVEPHYVIGLSHHPVGLTRDFERSSVQNVFDRELHFFHCGHLHAPSTAISGSPGNSCITVAAGATFESRQFRNSYSIVELEALRGIARVETHDFDTVDNTFYPSTTAEYTVSANSVATCGLAELASALRDYDSDVAALAAYLAALILGWKADVAIPHPEGHVFASIEMMEELTAGALCDATREILSLRNVVHAMYSREPLSAMLREHGAPIREYVKALRDASRGEPALWNRLEAYEADAQKLAGGASGDGLSHTARLLRELADRGDWSLLREQAGRHLDLRRTSEAPPMILRCYALGLANASDPMTRTQAIPLYRELTERERVDHTDYGNLALLLVEQGDTPGAKAAVTSGLKDFPQKSLYFGEIGKRLVEESGDRDFRDFLRGAMGGNNE